MDPDVKDYLNLISSKKHKMFNPFDELESVADGMSPKAFVRCYGKYLKDLFNEIKNNPNSSFITCCNDFIKDSSFEEFKKLPVSCIIKRTEKEDEITKSNEFLCCHLANILGIKTQYVMPLESSKGTMLMVDFLKDDEQFSTYQEIAGNQVRITDIFTNAGNYGNLRLWFEGLNMSLRELFKNEQWSDAKANKLSTIYTDFIVQLLTKRYLLHDTDCHTNNVGFVHNADYSKFAVAPLFDSEYAFKPTSKGYLYEGLDVDLKFINKCLPDQLKTAMKVFDITGKEESIKELFKKYEKSPKERARKSQMFFENIERINEAYKQMTLEEKTLN